MARKKKESPAVMQPHDDETMQTVVDFGEVTVPESWEQVTLGQLCAYRRKLTEARNAFEERKKEAKRKKQEFTESEDDIQLTVFDVLEVFAGLPREKSEIMPVEMLNAVMSRLVFMYEPMPASKPTNTIEVNGETLMVNFMESLKTLEMVDVEKVLKADPDDLCSLLAILCRKRTGRYTDNVTGRSWDINEPYTSEFSNTVFDARREMFEKMPAVKAYGLITFFLMRSAELSPRFSDSLTEISRQLDQYAENLDSSIRTMGWRRWLMMPQIIRLRKLRKSIRSLT